MAIFGNFKGTTQSDFRIGKSATGNKLSTGTRPATNNVDGDIYFDSANVTLDVYDSGWKNLGETLTGLNVSDGVLYVDVANETVSIGSTSSNETLFVNGSLRLGTTPEIKYTGTSLQIEHADSNTATSVNITDATGNSNASFAVSGANNDSALFAVTNGQVVIHDSYTLPSTDGTSGQALITNGNGLIEFGEMTAQAASITGAVQYNNDSALAGAGAFRYLPELQTVVATRHRAVIFESIPDYESVEDASENVLDLGFITETADVTNLDYQYVDDVFGVVMSDPYQVSRLPVASQPGQMIYVDDETGGPTMAFSDGTNWRRIQDRAIVS